ncbi:MAG: two-component regulator propeller domain-containing protein [Bacteroidota bacterium]
MNKYCLITLLCLLRIPCTYAQSPAYAHYGVQQGLPGNKVYCVTQDHRGFMWFGTDKGLARFDGTRFEVFGVKDGLPDPEVLNMFEDSRGRLWLSSFQKKPFYRENGRFVTAKDDSILARIDLSAALCDFFEDRDHNVWITGKTSVAYVFDGKTLHEKTYPGPETLAKIVDIGGSIYALGLGSIMQDNRVIGRVQYDHELYIAACVSGNRVLYSTSNHLFLLDRINGAYQTINTMAVSGGRVFSDGSGRFWSCPISTGAYCFDNEQHDLSNPVVYLPGKMVNAIYEDRHGTLWFCTGSDGVYVLARGKAATYSRDNGLTTNNITALSRTNSGQVLAGDDMGNEYMIQHAMIRQTALNNSSTFNRVRQIIPESESSCWIATDQGLFYKSDQKVEKAELVRGLKSILAQSDTLWFGTHALLGYFPGKQKQPVIVLKRRITATCKDDSGNIWAGSIDGLLSQTDHFQYNWGERFPALKNRIISLANAGGGNIWVVTPEQGLMRAEVSKGEIRRLEFVNQYLKQPIENIQSLFQNAQAGAPLWLATNSGVYRVQPDQWSLTHYDAQNGLADNDINCLMVADDTLWAGTVAGLSVLPLRNVERVDSFNTFISSVRYQTDNKSVYLNLLDSLPRSHRIVLPQGAAMITLLLAGLDYRSPEHLSYTCISRNVLPPIQWWTRQNIYHLVSGWLQPKIDTTIVSVPELNFGLTMPSGAYDLTVSANHSNTQSVIKTDHWLLIIRPDWYNTIWVDLLLWSLAFYAVRRILQVRSSYKKLNSAVSELQLRALQSQINPHFVGNSINAIHQFFYPPDRVGASKYIELFTRLLRRTIVLSEQHFNYFEDEIAYDRDYLEMVRMRFKERFQFDISGFENIPFNLPFPSMLLQPLLENATIHGLAPEGVSYFQLQFDFDGQQLNCTLTDNGMGIKAVQARRATKLKEQKSKGLELLEQKVKAFNQLYHLDLQLQIDDRSEDSIPAQGTRVRISYFPYKIKK